MIKIDPLFLADTRFALHLHALIFLGHDGSASPDDQCGLQQQSHIAISSSDNPNSFPSHHHNGDTTTQTRLNAQIDSEDGAFVVTPELSLPDKVNAAKITQAVLSAALRRIGLSGSGAKSVLRDRLGKAGVKENSQILELARLWNEHRTVDSEVHVNANRAGAERGRAPNWSKHETARLYHVIADPRHSTIIARMYQRIETRSELDSGRHDPFAHEFIELFNDESYLPDLPDAVCGVTTDLLLQFDSTLHPHKRNRTILKQRWGKLRSCYTAACEKYNKSGQGDPDTFPNYTNGDDSLSYMHCVFSNNPSLDAVIRALPPNAQIEAGLNEIEATRAPFPPPQTSSRKRRRKDVIESVAAALSKIAETSITPQPIVIQESTSAAATDHNLIHLERATKVALTVTSLMALESKIIGSIDSLPNDSTESATSTRILLENRLAQTRKIIETAMSSIEESQDVAADN